MAEHLAAPVSKVPWVVREPSNQALKDSRFCKAILSSEDKQKTETNLRLYSLINNAVFPYYLPSRYHSMDCVALKNMTKVKGHYWTHATHFLLSNQLHGVHLWKLTARYGSNPSLVKHLDSLSLLSTKKKSEMFKDGLELCKTSAEFLLDPWVLMQLPWHPVLLLQWTAGVLVEYYSLYLELVELYRWYLPHSITLVVNKLFKLLKHMPTLAFNALYHVQLHLYFISEEGSFMITSSFMNQMDQLFVPLLEFVTSGKARNIVRALKRMSFGSNFHMKNDKNYLSNLFDYSWEGTYNCMFSDHFWRQCNLQEVVGSYAEGGYYLKHGGDVQYLSGNEEFAVKATPHWISEMETKHGKNIESEKIFGLLEPMISNGVITQVSNPDLLKGIEFYKTYFTHCYYRLMELKANIDGGLRDEDAGVLYDVRYTRTKYGIADVQCAMLNKLAVFCFEKVTCSVQLHALNAEGPKMSLRQISEIIVKITEKIARKEKKSCWKDLKKRVPVSCIGKVDPKEECPKLAEEGTQKVAEKFEERIKRIMFNVFEEHEFWSENQTKLNPDQQIVQYILPCFVASLLEFADNEDVEKKDKENYVRIVHELIRDFEVDPYKVACMDGPFPAGFSPYILAGKCIYHVLRWQAELLLKGLQIALGSSLKANIVAETLNRNFISVLLDFEKSPFKNLANHPDFAHVLKLWPIQLYRLFGRILKAIETAVPGCLANLRVLEMTIMANICAMDLYISGNKSLDPTSTIADGPHNLDPIVDQLTFVTQTKARKLLGVQMHESDVINTISSFEELITFHECEKLSLEQISALVLYYTIPSLAGGNSYEMKDQIRVPMDRVDEAFFAYHSNDQVKLKLLLGKMFTRYGIDFSVVSYDFARKVAPLVYKRALTQIKNGRVQMQPCELTLLPIKHCRWCGLVRNNALRLCEECKADRNFPYRTWFCGDKCERQAMDKMHREEHARNLYMALGFEEMGTRVEVLPEGEAKKSAAELKKRRKEIRKSLKKR